MCSAFKTLPTFLEEKKYRELKTLRKKKINSGKNKFRTKEHKKKLRDNEKDKLMKKRKKKKNMKEIV